MGIPILPILGAISNLASTASDIYNKVNRAKKPDPLQERVARLEQSDLEQARLISEVSKDLEQLAKALQGEVEDLERFAKSIQAEMLASQKREAWWQRLLYSALGLAGMSLALSLYLLLR
ncbi:MAG TPA: hypothetical protein VNZ22_12140 [Bacillota bacterium]|nr:hypothetical protein [Bacillota bacterium]